MSNSNDLSGPLKLMNGDYTLSFVNGGVEVSRDGKLLYYNKRPVYAIVKSSFAASGFYDAAYGEVTASDGIITAKGMLTAPSGSEFSFTDTYEVADTGFKVSRKVKVLKATDDFGFSTKVSFVMTQSDDVHDYNCFAPGVWYKQNEFASEYSIEKDLC